MVGRIVSFAAVAATVLAFAGPAQAQSSRRAPHQAASFNGVSCVRATHCITVGWSGRAAGRKTLAERWDGAHWHVMSTRNASAFSHNSLSDVDCVSTTKCFAVGVKYDPSPFKAQPLIEVLNGSTWSLMSSPALPGQDGGLGKISCTSATSCVAVGTTEGDGILETYNGHAWKLASWPRPPGSPIELDDVSCARARCVALGLYLVDTATGYRQFMITRTGGQWHQTAERRSMSDVSCVATRCVGVGGYSSGRAFGSPGGPLVLSSENGGRWHVSDKGPLQQHAQSVLSVVDCVDATHCTALGTTTLFDSTSSRITSYKQVAGRSGGAAWSYSRPPGPAGSQHAYPSSISCAGSMCIAVGAFLTATGVYRIYTALHSASGWKEWAVPNPPNAV